MLFLGVPPDERTEVRRIFSQLIPTDAVEPNSERDERLRGTNRALRIPTVDREGCREAQGNKGGFGPCYLKHPKLSVYEIYDGALVAIKEAGKIPEVR